MMKETKTLENRIHTFLTTFGMKTGRIAFWNVRVLSCDTTLAQADAVMLSCNLYSGKGSDEELGSSYLIQR